MIWEAITLATMSVYAGELQRLEERRFEAAWAVADESTRQLMLQDRAHRQAMERTRTKNEGRLRAAEASSRNRFHSTCHASLHGSSSSDGLVGFGMGVVVGTLLDL